MQLEYTKDSGGSLRGILPESDSMCLSSQARCLSTAPSPWAPGILVFPQDASRFTSPL
jgi:hypothetical protein